jgi:hypothetical protein
MNCLTPEGCRASLRTGRTGRLLTPSNVGQQLRLPCPAAEPTWRMRCRMSKGKRSRR